MGDPDRLAGLIRDSSAVLIVTGAGISTRSGIPDFRGPKGVWKTQTPVYYQDFVRSEEARIEYWNQKLMAADVMVAAAPGVVHEACVRIEEHGMLQAIVTQNIDGLHTDAGSSAAKVIEVHGTGRESACLDCGDRQPIEGPMAEFAESGVPPRCSVCGGLLKPATISFGQALDPITTHRAVTAAEDCDLVIALGTTLSVYPAADVPLHAARRGVPYAIVNQGATDHDQLGMVTLRIDGEVGEVFGSAVEAALT